MNLKWEFEESDLLEWKSFVDANIKNDAVITRKKRNVTREKVDLSKNRLWFVQIACQVTTQQRSGPDSIVSKYLESDSPALSYEKCIRSKEPEKLILKELSVAGLRRSKVITKNLIHILNSLECGEWDTLISNLKSIKKNTTKIRERQVANYLCRSKNFPGLGPKQARNYIQWLGLSRYEIPIDSRITRKMRQFKCAFVPKSEGLNDETVYLLVQDGLQQLAKKLDIYPCILDACIFSSFDVK